MGESLLTSLFGMLDSRSIGGIAAALGASEPSLTRGLKSSIAAVLGCMASKSEDPSALHSLMDLTPSVGGETTMTQMVRAASDPNSPLISGGKRIISSLFGNTEGAVTDGISAASGLRTGTMSTVLAMAAPMVMSFLSRRVHTEGMNMRGLGSLLQGESGEIRNALPAGVANLFWPSTVRTATPVVAQAVEREKSSFNWLPLLLIPLLIGLFFLLHHPRRPVARMAIPAPVIPATPPLGTASRAITDCDALRRAVANNADLKFDTGSVQLRAESQAKLNTIADTLKGCPDIHLTISGYTDNVGRADQNLKLSQKRANMVMAQLVRKGVSADRLTAEGHGEESPIADNSTGAGRASNRRVSVDVLQH
jgi:OmpA-OmpF porin, OOP family